MLTPQRGLSTEPSHPSCTGRHLGSAQCLEPPAEPRGLQCWHRGPQWIQEKGRASVSSVPTRPGFRSERGIPRRGGLSRHSFVSLAFIIRASFPKHFNPPVGAPRLCWPLVLQPKRWPLLRKTIPKLEIQQKDSAKSSFKRHVTESV